MEIKCKCGSTNVFLENKGSQVGIYCSECGKWIKWATKEEARVIKHNEETIASGSIRDSDIYISMAEYKERLKIDLEAIFVGVQLEIAELRSEHINDRYDDGFQAAKIRVKDIIQQKIDAVKKGE